MELRLCSRLCRTNHRKYVCVVCVGSLVSFTNSKQQSRVRLAEAAAKCGKHTLLLKVQACVSCKNVMKRPNNNFLLWLSSPNPSDQKHLVDAIYIGFSIFGTVGLTRQDVLNMSLWILGTSDRGFSLFFTIFFFFKAINQLTKKWCIIWI